MTSLLRDARFAIRLLRRNPGFTVVSTLTLALGIGATTAIFSVVYGLFFAPLPYRQPDRLVMVWEQMNGQRRGPTPASYLAFKQQATAFADINAWGGGPVNLATADRPENVPAGRATPGFLGMLGYGHPLALGRSFVEDEGIAGRDKVVILTYRLWQDRFGGDPQIVGKPVRIDDEPHTVVGVLGEGPADHQQSKIWLPLVFTEAQLRSDSGSLNVMARLKDDVELPEANASLRALDAALERMRSEPRQGHSVSVEPFRNNFVRDSTKRGVWLLLGAVAFLLLIACANVANLLLTRGTSRRREVAIRGAIGATRGAVVRQLIVESVVVALVGGVLGAVLARGIIDAVVALMPAYTLPSETEIVLSVPVLLFAFGTCAIAGLLAGLAPAWRASRADVAEVMKEGGRSVSTGRDRLRRDADRRRVRAGADAARRRRHGRPRAPAHDERRPRLRCRTPDHVRAAGPAHPALDGRRDRGVLPDAPRAHAGAARRRLGVRVHRHAGGGRQLRHRVRDRRAPGAVGQRRQHGDAGLLPHLRHRHGPRPAADRRRSRRQHARRHRQPGLRQAIPGGRQSDRPARHVRAVRERHWAASRPGAVGDRRDPGRRRQRRPRARGAAGDPGVVLADPMAARDPRGEDDRPGVGHHRQRRRGGPRRSIRRCR